MLTILILPYLPTAQRWLLIAALTVGMLAAATWLLRTLPREERGLLDNPPDGEPHLTHVVRFLHAEKASTIERPRRLWLERKSFAESGHRPVPMARLWVEGESTPHNLTPWLAPQEARRLGDALARLLSLPLET